MIKKRLLALGVLVLGLAVGLFVYKTEPVNETTPQKPAILNTYFANHLKPFKLGLDLSGGTHLVYEADVSEIPQNEIGDAMDVLRSVVERRVNDQDVSGVLGVLEPLVQVKEGGIGNRGSQQLIVDLPGVTDVSAAVATIGDTPTLEFRIESEESEPAQATVDEDGNVSFDTDALFNRYKATGLTGRYLDTATVAFDQTTGIPYVTLSFTKEGGDLFAEITKNNVNKTLAIFLDDELISAPVVREEITGGEATINGDFTIVEAKELAGSLRYGALPVPVELVSSELIGPSLGAQALDAGLYAALLGFLAIAIFFVLWYRLPGLIAVFALGLYVSLTLFVFKTLHVTLSSAAIAGFIISIGIAVDANVLIFERIKEELRAGRGVRDAISSGFSRAWLSIRDSNVSTIITALILFFMFGGTFVRGFALTLLLGVLISMISAIIISRLFLQAVSMSRTSKLSDFLFGSGFTSAKVKK